MTFMVILVGIIYDCDTGLWYNGTNVNDLLEIHDCISTASLFINPWNGDFRLQDGSPCIEVATRKAAKL